MKSVRYLLLILCLFFLASCKEEKPIDEEVEKNPEIVEEHIHDLIHHEALEPTCTESGHNEYDECRTCDYSTLTIIPPLGHSYDSGVVTKEASCTEEGIITYTCTRCGDTYTKPIEKLEHEYELVEVIEPTYEVEGKKIYRCKVCGDEYYEVIDKKEYLSLSDVTGKDQDITKWNISFAWLDAVINIRKVENVKIILDLFDFKFQESDEYMHFYNSEGKSERFSILDFNFEGEPGFYFFVYIDIGVVECSVAKDGVTKYYYSYNTFEDYSFIKEAFFHLEFMERNPNYEFNPCIELEEGKKYSYFEVISYVLSSPSILTLEDATLFDYGGNGLFKSEDIALMYEFLEGEYEIIFDDRYFDQFNESQKTIGLGFVFDYLTEWNPSFNLLFRSRYGFVKIIDENNFGNTLLLYINGAFRSITIKGCFTLSGLDSISETFNKLYVEECKEAEENGMLQSTYWTKKYNENHNN